MGSTTGVFAEKADVLRPQIERELERYSDFSAGCPGRLKEAIRHSLLAPAKRLRPILVLSAAEACGSNSAGAMPAACAIEMVHTYSLIHDDLPAMDDDELRRGQPTCHVAFDEATAILAGDALLTRAFEILATELPTDVSARCAAELARAAGATQMVGGQADDLLAESMFAPPGAPSPEATDSQNPPQALQWLESIHQRKTGAMLTAALRMGAAVAGATDEQTQRLTAYGSRMGLAFQIVDDLLDATGSEHALGKRPGQDDSRGKLTFPSLLGIDASRDRASQLINDAIDQLKIFGSRSAHLESLAHFVLERNF